MKTRVLTGSKHEIADSVARIRGNIHEVIVFLEDPTEPASGSDEEDTLPRWLRVFQRRFTLLPNRSDLLDLWHALVESTGIAGLKSYDARLVAAMQGHGISRSLTFNAGDFNGLGVTTVDPNSI